MSTALQLLKTLELLQKTDEDHPLMQKDIVEAFAADDIAIERRSIARYIEALREYGYDILRSSGYANDGPKAPKGYFLGSRPFEEWELKFLCDATMGSRILTTEQAEVLFQKLLMLTGTGGRKLLAQTQGIDPPFRTVSKSIKYNIDAVLQALKRERKITFQYFDLDSHLNETLRHGGALYTADPYTLFYDRQKYYLYGYSATHKNVVLYRVDRMKTISITNEIRRSPQEVFGPNWTEKMRQQLKGSTYAFAGKPIRITLRFESHLLDDVMENFGSFVDLKECDGAYQALISTQDSDGLYYWLMQRAASVQIVGPTQIREKLVQQLKSTLNLYI